MVTNDKRAAQDPQKKGERMGGERVGGSKQKNQKVKCRYINGILQILQTKWKEWYTIPK